MANPTDRHDAGAMTSPSSTGLARSHGRSSGPGSQAGVARRSARGGLELPRITGFLFRWSDRSNPTLRLAETDGLSPLHHQYFERSALAETTATSPGVPTVAAGSRGLPAVASNSSWIRFCRSPQGAPPDVRPIAPRSRRLLAVASNSSWTRLCRSRTGAMPANGDCPLVWSNSHVVALSGNVSNSCFPWPLTPS